MHQILSIHFLLDSIFWQLHGNCEKCHGLRQTELIGYYDRKEMETCRNEHVRQLYKVISVSKLWSNVAIPQLWRFYADAECILSLVANMSNSVRGYKMYYRTNKKVSFNNK